MIKKVKVYSKSRTMNIGTVDNYGLGITNDNLVDTLLFEFDEMIDGQATLLTDLTGADGIAAPLSLERVENGYQIDVTKEMLMQESFNIQLQVVNGDMVWHSQIYEVKVKECLETGTGEMPSGIDLWIQEADNKLLEVNNKIFELEELVNELNENEEIRKLNEEARNENEDIRELSEEQRSEREIERIENEIKRVNAEDVRQTTEMLRRQFEQERQTNETLRENNENERVEYYNEIQRKVNDGEFNGEDGITPNVTVGTTTTGQAGTKAQVTVTGTKENPIFNFTIPKGDAGEIKLFVVNELPTVGQANALYFVLKEKTETGDLYDEYTYINNQWELIGNRTIDIDLSEYYKKEETDALLNTKQDKLTAGENISIIENVISAKGGDAFYIGQATSYNSQANAYDLTDKLGMYTFGNSVYANIYFKYKINDEYVYFSDNMSSVSYPNLAYFDVTNKLVSGLTSGTVTLGKIYYINVSGTMYSYTIKTINYKYSTNTFEISNSSSNSTYVNTKDAQTITGLKTFNKLPQSSVTPTNDNDLVNKKYVDENGGGDLSNYYTKEETDDLLEDKQNTLTPGDNINIENNVISAEVPDLTNYYDKEEVDNLLDDKQTTLIPGENISIVDNVISAVGGGSSIPTITEDTYIRNLTGTIYKVNDDVKLYLGAEGYETYYLMPTENMTDTYLLINKNANSLFKFVLWVGKIQGRFITSEGTDNRGGTYSGGSIFHGQIFNPNGNDRVNQITLNDKLLVGVFDNLTSTSTTIPLSANQGRVLNERITNEIGNINTILESLAGE